MCTSQRSLENLTQEGKNSTSKAAATPLVQNLALSLLPTEVQQATNTAPFPGQYQVQPVNPSLPWWAWGLHPCPGIKTGTCGRKGHSISSIQDHQPVPMISQLSSLIATLQQQHREHHIALQLHIL